MDEPITAPERTFGRTTAETSGPVADPSDSASPKHGNNGNGRAIPAAISPLLNSSGPFGATLEPALRDACAGRLTDIHWFRTDWQRSGAATGYAKYRTDDEREHDVVVKLPVKPIERQWLRRLQGANDVAPVVHADGQTLGGYDMAWVVMEKLEHGPLGSAWGGAAFDLTIDAAGRFYAFAADVPVDRDPPGKDWEKILDVSRRKVREHNVHEEQKWNKALKKAQKKLKTWLKTWNDRPIDQWCHGDLHLANAMSRTPAPDGPAILLDFAEVHPGNWLEDAVYFEHLFWSRREQLDGRKICSLLAKQRRDAGLPTCEKWPQLADVRRALLAMSVPARLEHMGDPAYVRGALEVLEASVG